MKKQVIIALTLLIAAMFFVASVNLQSQKESLVVEVLSFNGPIKIDSLKVGNLAVQSGEKFVATEDWLKELSVNIKNSFGKTVTYIDVGVFVGRPKDQEEVPMFHYSILRGSKINALKRINSGLEFKSSDSIESNLNIAISDKEYKEIQESLEQLNYSSRIEKLQIQVEEVVFDDGTMWSSGSWYKYNPDDPKNPIRINGKKGGENEIAALLSNRITEETADCGEPQYLNESCNRDGSCQVRYLALLLGSPVSQARQAFQRCYLKLPNGGLGE